MKEKSNSRDFKTILKPLVKKMPLITLTEDKEKELAPFLLKNVKEYMEINCLTELKDKSQWVKSKSILCAEAVLETLLGVRFIQYKMNKQYQYIPSTLFNGQLSVCVFPFGTLPIIPKNNNVGLIFMMQKDTKNFYICGVADRLTLNSFRDTTLVPFSEPNADKRAVFYGFTELNKFSNMEELTKAFTR